MSVLFDRLCALAAADRVLVVLAIDAGNGDHAFDLAEALGKAAQDPGLDVWLIPPPRARPHAAPEPAACHRSVEEALLAVRRGDARSIRVAAGCVSARDDVPQVSAPSGASGPMLFVAADRPGWTEQLAASADRGVGFSVGAIDPAANFHVAAVDGALAALDALIDLRAACSSEVSTTRV